MGVTPTEKDFRVLFSLIDGDELRCSKIGISQDTFDMLMGPIAKAARLLLDTISKRQVERSFFILNNHKTKIGEILMKISEHPDEELSEQQATLLCRGIAEGLDDTDDTIADAAYTLLSCFLPKADKETRDLLIPAMVVHDL